jgi:hypothetical protein
MLALALDQALTLLVALEIFLAAQSLRAPARDISSLMSEDL